jgi:hypothetical protein
MAENKDERPRKELVSDEILTTNTGVRVNVTAAVGDPVDAEKTICILCNHIDEVDTAHKKVVAEFKRIEAENKRRLESCELEVARHRKQTLEEISLKLRAERKIPELEKKLEENEVRNLKQKKKIQELENMNRTMKRDHAETFENMKKKVEEAVLRMAAREKAADEAKDTAEPVTEQ